MRWRDIWTADWRQNWPPEALPSCDRWYSVFLVTLAAASKFNRRELISKKNKSYP